LFYFMLLLSLIRTFLFWYFNCRYQGQEIRSIISEKKRVQEKTILNAWEPTLLKQERIWTFEPYSKGSRGEVLENFVHTW